MRVKGETKSALSAVGVALALILTGAAWAAPLFGEGAPVVHAPLGDQYAAAGAGPGAGSHPGPPPTQSFPPAPPAPPAPPQPPVTGAPQSAGASPASIAPPTSASSSGSAASGARASFSAARGAGAASGAPKFHPVVTLPPAGQGQYVASQVVVAIPNWISPRLIASIVRRHHLVEKEAVNASLAGLTFHVWVFVDKRSLERVERELAREAGLKALQPNFVYHAADEVAAVSATTTPPGLYALDNLRVAVGLDVVGHEPIKVAIVDTAIDEAHPDLAGAVWARYDAIGGGGPPHSMEHGTAMAGAIAGNGQVRGVAPSVRLLSARAFDTDGSGGALGSSVTIIKAIEWSVKAGARIINMSFAGPKDPAMHNVLAAAEKKGVVLIGAMGNAGPKSPPLYPGADENVIAITATDFQDHVYTLANVGPYVTAAAPGVEVLLPAPNGGYALETGTSVSAALASGVAALALQRRPGANLQDMRKWFASSARPPASPQDKTLVGAGVIDASATVKAAGP